MGGTTSGTTTTTTTTTTYLPAYHQPPLTNEPTNICAAFNDDDGARPWEFTRAQDPAAARLHLQPTPARSRRSQKAPACPVVPA